jgi:membrane-bound metal-dependent hydrolase YbcI (DUF457 family)
VLVAAASHGLLDALTNGGLGVALLWPLSDARFFAPLRPIQVAPLRHVLGARAVAALGSELVRVWGPCALLALTLRAWRLATARAHLRRLRNHIAPARPRVLRMGGRTVRARGRPGAGGPPR